MTAHTHKRVPLLLWPFWLVWRLVEAILVVTGRLVAVILGLVFMLLGAILTLTVIGAILGIPLFIIGLLLVFRGLF